MSHALLMFSIKPSVTHWSQVSTQDLMLLIVDFHKRIYARDAKMGYVRI